MKMFDFGMFFMLLAVPVVVLCISYIIAFTMPISWVKFLSGNKD